MKSETGNKLYWVFRAFSFAGGLLRFASKMAPIMKSHPDLFAYLSAVRNLLMAFASDGVGFNLFCDQQRPKLLACVHTSSISEEMSLIAEAASALTPVQVIWQCWRAPAFQHCARAS